MKYSKSHKCTFTHNIDSDTNHHNLSRNCDMPLQKEIKVSTDQYRKDTKKPGTLLPPSSHPKHISRNMPYRMPYRYVRICSAENDFKKYQQKLGYEFSIPRKYDQKVIMCNLTD